MVPFEMFGPIAICKSPPPASQVAVMPVAIAPDDGGWQLSVDDAPTLTSVWPAGSWSWITTPVSVTVLRLNWIVYWICPPGSTSADCGILDRLTIARAGDADARTSAHANARFTARSPR